MSKKLCGLIILTIFFGFNAGLVTAQTQNDIYGTWLWYETCMTINGDYSEPTPLPSHTTITKNSYILHTRDISPLEITSDYLIIGDRGNSKKYRYKLLSKDILIIQHYDFADDMYMKFKRENKVISEVGEPYKRKYIMPMMLDKLKQLKQ